MSELEGNKIKKYWDDRSSWQGDRTVGFGNQPMTVQDTNYRQRYEFVVPFLNNKIMTLDYGCGIGRYTDFFSPNLYIGVDVCETLLKTAKRNNPDYSFLYIPDGKMPEQSSLTEYKPVAQVFTATVLQHNSDNQVLEIFKSWKPHLESNCTFIFYENCHNTKDKKHIAFRQPDKYRELVGKIFKIMTWKNKKHVIHGEEHAIMQFECCKN